MKTMRRALLLPILITVVAPVLVTACRGKSPEPAPVAFQPTNFGIRGEVGTPGHTDSFVRRHELRNPDSIQAEEVVEAPRQPATGPRVIEEREFPERLRAMGLSPGSGLAQTRGALGPLIETTAIANDESGYMITRPADGHGGWYLVFRNSRLVDWREVPR